MLPALFGMDLLLAIDNRSEKMFQNRSRRKLLAALAVVVYPSLLKEFRGKVVVIIISLVKNDFCENFNRHR